MIFPRKRELVIIKLDSYTMISGANIPFSEGITIRQPTLADIRDIRPELWSSASPPPRTGFEKYSAYINFLALRMEDVVEQEAIVSMPDELKNQLSVFMLFISKEQYLKIMLEALSFFICEELHFNSDYQLIETSGGGFIDADLYDKLRIVILGVCCANNDDLVKPKFGGAKSRSIFEKIQRGREKFKKAGGKTQDMAYTIPNIISAVSAKHPSINLLNIWGLTVYQLYDQFSRTSINAQTEIIGLRWAAWGKESFDFTTWFKNIDK